MDTQKLKVKDLVTIGVFAIIYFIVYYAVGMIGLVPFCTWCSPQYLLLWEALL